MILDFFIFAVSLAILLYSSDALIDTAVAFAERLKVSAMVIGLTIVAIGTSLPELMASSVAAFKGHPEIAIGNVVGSNICNVGLILGLPALFFTISCRRKVIQREGIKMLLVSVSLMVLGVATGEINRYFGIVFVVLFFAFIARVFSKARKESQGGSEEDSDKDPKESDSETAGFAKEAVQIAVLLVLLLGSSKFLVDSTIALATDFGVSEAVIAISLIALGTSLPELSVSMAAARKNQGDILVGNVLGSNISNILLVLGTTAMINPFKINSTILFLDFPVMIILAALMVFFLYRPSGIERKRGLVLLSIYALVIVRCVLVS